MTDAPAPPRSGCAVAAGVLLIGVGSLFLVHNVLSFAGISPVRVGSRALVWFGAYWPLLLVAWGAYKVYERVSRPERAHVGAAEVVILAWIVVAGLAIRGAQRAMDELAVEVSADDLTSVLGPDLLGPPHRVVETASFDLDGARSLVVENRRGHVVVVGSEGSRLEVTLTKLVHSFSEIEAGRALAQVGLELAPGDEARLETTRGERARAAVTDLEIRAPRTLSVSVRNRRGAVRIESLDAPAHVATTNGSVEATNLSSGIEAATTHATIRLERIAGDVVVRNEHGAVRAFGIDGDVVAEAEHSAIAIDDVTGRLSVKTEHGTVRAADVGGDVRVEGPYSDVSVEQVRRNVHIASSHRPVFVHDVGGRLEVRSRYAPVMIRVVASDVTVENLQHPVNVADVGGSVSVRGEKSSVDAVDVEGAVTIATTHDDVRVRDFGARVDVRASDADVDVSTNRLLGDVYVETSRGDVSVALPASASARISARTRSGELRSELESLSATETGTARGIEWEGVLGSGAQTITIETSYGDVALRSAEAR